MSEKTRYDLLIFKFFINYFSFGFWLESITRKIREMKRQSRVKPSFVCINMATALAHLYFQKDNFVDTYISQLIKIARITHTPQKNPKQNKKKTTLRCRFSQTWNLKSSQHAVAKQKFALCMVQYAYINHWMLVFIAKNIFWMSSIIWCKTSKPLHSSTYTKHEGPCTF